MRKLLLIPLAISLVFFFEAILTDLVYSSCYAVGSPNMYCSGAVTGAPSSVINLYPLVGPIGHGYLLGPLATSRGMGIVAGLSFLGIFASVFFLKGFRISLIASSAVYLGMLSLFGYFYPLCVEISCRVTNYLPFISYDEGGLIAIGSLIVCGSSYLWKK